MKESFKELLKEAVDELGLATRADVDALREAAGQSCVRDSPDPVTTLATADHGCIIRPDLHRSFECC